VELFCQVTCYNLVDAPLNEESEAIGIFMEIPLAPNYEAWWCIENFIDLPQGRNSALDFEVHAGEVKVRLEFLPRNRWSI